VGDPDAGATFVVAVTTAPAAGYRHPDYAASLAEFGALLLLPESGGWALRRPIEGSPHHDLMGPYPLFFCSDWERLPHDLRELPQAAAGAVSFAMVADPFAALAPDWLAANFDVAFAFKDHFIADLSQPIEAIVSTSHQATVRRALRKVAVSVSRDPRSRLEQWVALYDHLTERHRIGGIRAFSRQAFARQLGIPGLFAFEAHEIATGELVGMDLWYLQGNVAYGHLAAFNPRGYELRASYATKWEVLRYFSDKADWVHLSGSAGLRGTGQDEDGLARFKRGWSTGTRKAFFCGKILDHAAYRQLVQARAAAAETFFPAYRRGQF
jgi:hypothetical protein